MIDLRADEARRGAIPGIDRVMNRRQLLAAAGSSLFLPTALRAAPPIADDLAILRQALALHPGLHRYLSPRQVEAGLAKLGGEWSRTTTLATRYLALSRFLATIRCGHSYANFFNQKASVAAALFDQPTRLPFRFRWIDARMIVTADDSGTSALPRGSEILSVNGVAAKAMLAALMPYARADGHNDAKRIALLEVHGNENIEYFDVFQGLLFPPDDGVHHLDVRLPDGRRRRIVSAATSLAARRALQPAKRDIEWDWTMRPDGIAVLTMPGWAMYDSKWDWQAWLDERLTSLSGAKGLIIDLRDNEGGNDCGDMILARLAGRTLTFPQGHQRIRFRRTPATLDPYLDTWDNSFRTLGESATDLGDGWFSRPGPASDDSIPAKGPRLTLPVAALVGPTNSSATFQFAQRGQQTGLVHLIGAPTGGNRRGINGGCFFFVRLPDSGIEFDLPLVGYFPDTPQPDAGIMPDQLVRPTIADITAGRDPELAAAVAWCARS